MFWETCMNSETKPAAISQSKSLNPFNNTQYKTRCICSEKHGWFQKPNLWIEARLYSLPWKTPEQAHISIACKNIEWRIHYTFNGYIEKCVWSTLDPWLCDLLSCAICSWAVRSVFPLGRPNRQPSHGILTHSCKAKQFGGRTWTFPPLCGQNGESFGAYVTFDFWALFFVCLNDFFLWSFI